MNQINTKWLGIHLYYNTPSERILSDAVLPFIESMLEQKLISNYFFIRYFEHGPHIRLRLKGEEKILNTQVKLYATSFFSEYIKQNPSGSIHEHFLKFYKTDGMLYPNNSIQWIEYLPELKRYGGKHAIIEAERHFQNSSETVLINLKNNVQEWSYEVALGTAIQMHLGFTYGTGMSKKEIFFFYKKLYQDWFPQNFQIYNNTNNEFQKIENEKVAESFYTSFNQQKDFLVPYISELWNEIKKNKAVEEIDWLESWIDHAQQIDTKLKALNFLSSLHIPEDYQQLLDSQNINRPELFLYESFFHMTNNRLGLLNNDEGFLAFLLMESLSIVLNSEK